MTLRYVYGALTAVLLTGGVPAVAPAYAQNHDGDLLPRNQSGWVTVAGCLQPRGKHGDKFALATPMPPVDSVTEDTCNSPLDYRAYELDDPEQAGITQAMYGRWVEIYGKLEKETSTNPENYRELDVKTFRLVPVVRPIAEAAPAPVPRYEPQPEPAPLPETPVATTGTPAPPELPKTASSLPAVGLLGLLSLAGAFAVRVCLSPRS